MTSERGYWYTVRPGQLFDFLSANYSDTCVQVKENFITWKCLKQLILDRIKEKELYWPEYPFVRLDLDPALRTALGQRTLDLSTAELDVLLRAEIHRVPGQTSLHLYDEETGRIEPFFGWL